MTFREVSIEGPPGEFTTSDTVDAKLLFGGFEILEEDVSDGFAPLQAPISLSGAVCSLGQTAIVAFLSGTTATASFMPGNLKIEGGQVAAVSGFGDPLAAKSLMLTVLGPDDPSAFTDPPPLRSSVVLEGGAVWHVSLPATDTPIGTLTTLADLYDQLSAEVGEDASGIRREVALFRAQSKADQFQLALASGITDLNDAPLLVGLSGALQFYNFESATPQVELLCSGRPVSPWAKSAGTGLLLGPGDPEQLLLFAFDGAKTTVLRCRFSLFGLVPPLNGAIVDPGDPVGSLSILPVGTAPDPAGELNWVLIGSLQHGDVRLRISGPTFNVLRPEDLLALKFRFEGMALLGSDGQAPGLAMAQAGRQGRLSITFPQQHLVEHSYYSPDPTLLILGDPPGTETPDPNQPIAVRLGEESRLSFVVPPDSEPISLDLQSLLSWSKLVQDIVKPASYLPSQQPAPGEQVGPQQPLSETSIELPYRLTLSPNASAGWSHRDEPVTHGEWTELWHTRLGVRKSIDSTPGEFFADERDTDENLKLRAVRAVSSPDWPTPAGEPFPRGLGKGSALTSQDRHDIVANSSDFTQQSFLPQPAFVKRLMLSGLGGWLDARALWEDNPNHISLQEWRHIAAQGRDQYVRVVRRGHLFPFGHRASWVTISERKFFGDLGGDPAFNRAYVFERDFIVVTQPVCRYGNLSNSNTKGRDLPFTEIEITTLTTPTLDPPGDHLIAANAAGQPIVFWIYQQGGAPFLFHKRARDQDTSSDPRGRPVDFSAAAIFVDETAQFLTDIANAAKTYDKDNLAKADMGGQKIALAKSAIAGDTTYEVESFTFKTGVSPVPPSSPGDPTSNSFLIYPSVAHAAVHLPAVRQLTKPKDGAADQAVIINYYTPYLTDQANEDFANNMGEVFAQLASPLNIGFSGDRATGIASPDMQITGLSRKFGTVAGDISMLAQAVPKFDPGVFFQGGANPTLLGGIKLKDVIATVPGPESQGVAEDSVPVLKIDSSAPDQIVANFSWNPTTVPSFSASGLTITFGVQRLSLNSTIVTPLNPNDSVKAITNGELNDFKLDFLGFVTVAFDRLKFTAEKGQKPQVNVDFATPDPVTLGPKLDFLQPLVRALKDLPLDRSNDVAGVGSGLSIDIEDNVVKAGYTLAIPAIAIGVFSLENIRFGVGVSIPLSNDPVALGFNFSEKDHPFNLTIALLGGGGFFAIEVDAEGIQRLEFAIEAAANLSLDLGVASGSAHVAIGVYFHFEDQNTLITGYLRAGGELTILKVVSLHVELYLGLTYASTHGQQIIWGEASLTVEVAVAFLHQSVTLTMRREFVVGGQRISRPRRTVAGLIRKPVRPLSAPGPGEFSVAVMLTEQDWRDYALAFA